jgi:hypothetical protein
MLLTPSKPLFHSVAVGFMLGYGIVFLPFLILGLLFSGTAERMGWGLTVGFTLIGLPLMVAANSYVLSAFVMLGLWFVAKLRGSKA